jgi:cytochrome P450
MLLSTVRSLLSCVGYRIAVVEMVLTLGNLLRCFDPELSGPLDLAPRHKFISHPREEIRLKLKPRAAAAAVAERT